MSVIGENFTRIAQHSLEGLMFHHDMTDYFDFLALGGFSALQEFRFLEEAKEYENMKSYYMERHHKLLNPKVTDRPQVIPSSWYNFAQSDVSSSDRQNGLRNGMKLWIEWEQKTLDLYCEIYNNIKKDCLPDALYVQERIGSVRAELSDAESISLHLTAMNYDLPTIMAEQGKMEKKYAGKIRIK